MGFRKLLIPILFIIILNSCARLKPCLLECYTSSNEIIVILNSKYKIGDIKGGAIEDVEFANFYTDNFTISRDQSQIKIVITNENFVFENGKFYKLYVSWFGGSVETIAEYQDGHFIINWEEYHNLRGI